jgi:hypothetical protein
MDRFLRISYNLVLGAWAALVAWALLDPVWSLTGIAIVDPYLRALADGALVGVFVGAMIGALEKYNTTTQAGPTALGCFIGALIGLIGGVVGLLLANFLFLNLPLTGALQQGLIVIGWAIFGVAVGIAPGIAAWSLWKTIASSLGGCLGGLVGGAVLLALASSLRLPWIARAMGFVLLAVFVGMFIAFIQAVTKRATIKITQQRVQGRPREGLYFDIFKQRVSVGSGRDDWIISNDPQIAPRHIEIRQEGGKFVLHSMIPNNLARVQNQPAQKYVLNDGDRFWIGATEIAFKVKK